MSVLSHEGHMKDISFDTYCGHELCTEKERGPQPAQKTWERFSQQVGLQTSSVETGHFDYRQVPQGMDLNHLTKSHAVSGWLLA